MPNVMAAQPNIVGTLCESSVIPFLTACRKFWLTLAARVPYRNAANRLTVESKTWMQSEFDTWQIPLGGKSPRRCIHTVSAQETVKHRATGRLQGLVGNGIQCATSLQ